MKPCLLDTDILSLFFRNHPQVVHCCNLYLQEYRQLSFSLITYYEILSGLKHRDAQKQLDKFLEFSQGNQILLLTDKSVTISAKIWLFGLCDAMDGGYKGWNPYIERHLAIFVNCFCLERTNQLSLLPDKDLVDLCPPIEP